MTQHQDPPQQPWPNQPLAYGTPAQPPAPRKRKAPVWLIVTTAIIVGLCGIGTVAAIATSGTELDEPPAPGQREAPAEPAGDAPAPPPDEPAEPDYPEPKADDFELTIKTLTKECFGSAGCNISFRVELAYGGPDLDPAVTYELTYEVKGGDDPYINTMTVTGDEYSTQQEEFIGTPSSSAELKAVVTSVSEF